MDALKSVLDMAICVTNRLVPADDEYEVSLVSGSDGHPVESLLGSRYDQEAFERVISGRYEQAPGLHVIPPDAPEWAEFEGAEFIPKLEPNSESERPWNPGQELFVALRDREETVLAVLSLDAPLAGELPPEDRLVLASLVAHHAATTLEARIAESETALANREAEALADIVGSLEAGSTEEELVLHAVEGIRSVCGYHTVEVHLTATDEPGQVAWSPPVRGGPRAGDAVEPRARRRAAAPRAHDLAVVPGSARRAGAHRLVPGRAGPARRTRQARLAPPGAPDPDRAALPQHLGFVLADNPLDRLLPTIKRVRRLEAFAMQIGLMIDAGRSLAEARIRAEIDPLTKLANRSRLYADIQKALGRRSKTSIFARCSRTAATWASPRLSRQSAAWRRLHSPAAGSAP